MYAQAAISFAVTLVLAAYALLESVMRKKPALFQRLAAAIAAGSAIFLYQSTYYLLYVPLVAVFYLIGSTYLERKGMALAAAGLAYVLLVYGNATAILMQAALIGLFFSMRAEQIYVIRKSGRNDMAVEGNRDAFQIFVGLLIALAYFLAPPERADLAVLAAIILGYGFVSLIMNSDLGELSRMFKNFERKGVRYASGASWLAIGMLLSLSVLQSAHQILLVIAALFFADSAATIIGMRSKRKLFYNNRKSYAGTIAYFLIVAAFGYFLIGAFALVAAAVAALVESVDIHIDDNLDVAIALVLLFAIYNLLA